MTSVTCDRCGLATLGTERVVFLRGGRELVGEVDLCPRCIDRLIDAIGEQTAPLPERLGVALE
jgi:hypothetical protein